jgi:hypothetical protein
VISDGSNAAPDSPERPSNWILELVPWLLLDSLFKEADGEKYGIKVESLVE